MSFHAERDTIAAVSSPLGFARRAIVRLSGPEALAVVSSVFETGGKRDWEKGFRATRGALNLIPDGVSTPAAVYVMRSPHSYTREDVVELHVPGSPALSDMILDMLLEQFPGQVRLAKPGEFTERAFLNGRIDLAQAEAVLSIITARNKSELLAANARLAGSTSRLTGNVKKGIVELRAAIEAALDFEAHGIETVSEEDFIGGCRALREKLETEIRRKLHDLTSDGYTGVVICGPPNAGKSSLLNRLSGKENALVHETAGTTRDPVTEKIEIDGISFAVTDTAGMEWNGGAAGTSHAPAAGGEDGGADAGIGSLAASRAQQIITGAQLMILVFDASRPAPERWKKRDASFEKRPALYVFNKCDLSRKASPDMINGAAGEIIYASALSGEGVDRIKNAMVRAVTEGGLGGSAADCMFNARQRTAAGRAVTTLKEAEQAVRDGIGYEFAAIHLREASEALSDVTGTAGDPDVLDCIFRRFCIGK